MSKEQFLNEIMKALDQGYDVEVKKNRDGALVMLKVKKEILARCELA